MPEIANEFISMTINVVVFFGHKLNGAWRRVASDIYRQISRMWLSKIFRIIDSQMTRTEL